MKYSLLKLSALSAAIINPSFAAFHKDARINTNDGPLTISKLEIGQLVSSYSPRSLARGMAMVVAKSLGHNTNWIVKIDTGKKKIKAMPDQVLFDVGGHQWVKAKDLTTDHVLLGEDGSLVNIVGIKSRRRKSFSLPHELMVAHKDHTFFVDGVLNHNMLSAFVKSIGDVTDLAGKEGVKKTILNNVTGPELLGIKAMGKIGEWAYEGIQEENELIARGEFVPHDRKTTFAEQSGAWNVAPSTPVKEESRPGSAPRSHATKADNMHAAVGMGNQSSMRPHVWMLGPGPSSGKRTGAGITGRSPNNNNNNEEENRRVREAAEYRKILVAEAKKREEYDAQVRDRKSRSVAMTEAEVIARRDAGLPYKYAERQNYNRTSNTADVFDQKSFLADPLAVVLPSDSAQRMQMLEEMGRVRAAEQLEKNAVGKAALLQKCVQPEKSNVQDIPEKRAASSEEVQKLNNMFGVVSVPEIVDLPKPVSAAVLAKIYAKSARDRLEQFVHENDAKLAEEQRRADAEIRALQVKESESATKYEYSRGRAAESERYESASEAIHKRFQEARERLHARAEGAQERLQARGQGASERLHARQNNNQ